MNVQPLFLILFFSSPPDPLISGTPRFTPASATIRRSDFASGKSLNALHRGLNIASFASSSLLWDEAEPGSTGFNDVAASADFCSLINDLSVGSIRIPGGSDANYYNYTSNQAWVSWAVDAADQYNAAGVDWSTFWDFHEAIGEPPLMSTVNVYRNGNPDFSDDADISAIGDWVSDYASDRGITGAYWEAGNETYIAALLPGLSYPSDYASRACEAAEAIHSADPTARAGLVVYEHGDHDALFDAVDSVCDLDDFDFLIIHDYAPLVPKKDDGSDPEFDQDGVEKSLAYQNLTQTVSDLRAFSDKPIYVTEYGLLYDLWVFDGYFWLSEWYQKGVALLLLKHRFNLIEQGADGLWFWEALSGWFRLIDPDALEPVRLYQLLAELHEQHGTLISVPVTGSRTFDVEGVVGSGCIEGWSEACWHTALDEGEVLEDQPYLEIYAVLSGSRVLRPKMWITVLNFGGLPQSLTLNLEGWLSVGSLDVERFSTSASSWNAELSEPTTSTISASSSGLAHSIERQFIPARSAVIFAVSF
jgi:hypothetical protein